MKRRNGFAAIVALVVIFCFAISAYADQAPKAPTDVNVVNNPPVQAQQSGVWNVGISGTPDVNVSNAVQVDDSTPIQVDTGQGIRPSDIVSLTKTNAGCTNHSAQDSFVEIGPNGGSGPHPYKVPDGYVFVLTSLQYQTIQGPANGLVQLFLYRVDPNSVLWEAMTTGTIANEAGKSVSSETFPTGVVFGPGIEPCVGVPNNNLIFMTMQGYLAPDN